MWHAGDRTTHAKVQFISESSSELPESCPEHPQTFAPANIIGDDAKFILFSAKVNDVLPDCDQTFIEIGDNYAKIDVEFIRTSIDNYDNVDIESPSTPGDHDVHVEYTDNDKVDDESIWTSLSHETVQQSVKNFSETINAVSNTVVGANALYTALQNFFNKLI